MLIFSFDCGTVRLGISIVNYDTDCYKKLFAVRQIIKETQDISLLLKSIQEANSLLSNIITLKYAGMVNLIPNLTLKSSKEKDRLNTLKHVLHTLDKRFGEPDKILVEDQMHINNASNIVQSAIIYHYSNPDKSAVWYDMVNKCQTDTNTTAPHKYELYLIGPSLKNKYTIDVSNPYYKFISKYTKRTSNKKHALAQFEYFCKIHCIDISKFKGESKFDVADSFMQCYAWIAQHYMRRGK